MRVLIVLPTYNEAENILTLLDFIDRIRRRLKWLDVYVIDDDSPDGTGKMALSYSFENPWVSVRIRRGRRGFASALYEGFRYAYSRGYDYVITMDADLQHNPIYIPYLLSKAIGGCDVVIASRYIMGGGIVGWSLKRRLISLAANLYARIVLGLYPLDVTSGYKCYSRRSLAIIVGLGVLSKGYAVQPETIYKVSRYGLRICEVPFTFVYRRRGRSKMGLKVIFEYFYLIPALLLKG